LKYYFYSYRNLSPNLTGLSDYRLYLDGWLMEYCNSCWTWFFEIMLACGAVMQASSRMNWFKIWSKFLCIVNYDARGGCPDIHPPASFTLKMVAAMYAETEQLRHMTQLNHEWWNYTKHY
jgi:hypothetical protein